MEKFDFKNFDKKQFEGKDRFEQNSEMQKLLVKHVLKFMSQESKLSKLDFFFYTDSKDKAEALANDLKKINYEVAKFPWAASGRAVTLDRNDGVTKILVDPTSQRILGIGICGPGAGELIAEGVLAIEMGANLTDLKLTIHPHPTLSETLMEAAEVFFGQSTHVYRPKKG